jgi:hypothetical protein
MIRTLLALALVTAPSIALAKPSSSHAATKQKQADDAKKSAAKHAAHGDDAAAKNMAKIAEQRQKAADRAKGKK